MKKVESTIDPFDPASLRIDRTAVPELGVKTLLLNVPVRRPKKQEYFRARPDADFRMAIAILELEEERETYAVTPSIAAELLGEVSIVEIRVCITLAGTLLLWPVPLPTSDGPENSWNKSKRAAAEHAEIKWIRMTSDRGAGAYKVIVAEAAHPDPVWPDTSFGELLRIAFDNGRLIDTLDHPVIKRLRGS
jgi:hypothetical protein